jgi:hypothetical protein
LLLLCLICSHYQLLVSDVTHHQLSQLRIHQKANVGNSVLSWCLVLPLHVAYEGHLLHMLMNTLIPWQLLKAAATSEASLC